MDIAAVLVSILALSFTIFAFWWMNWRRGKLHVGAPRSYAAIGSVESKLIIQLPLVFFNDSPMPIIIRNLRLMFTKETDPRPLTFMATTKKLATDEDRALASQLPIRGREAVLVICEFQRHRGGMFFEQKSYPMKVQAMLDESDQWETLCDFSLNVSAEAMPTINKAFTAYDNMAED